MTGRSALCSVAMATLPNRIFRAAERPRDPTAMTAASRSRAVLSNASAQA